MQYPQGQNCCDSNYQNNCYTGCGTQYPIVPGFNPALNYWNGQNFIVADGSQQNQIILPFIKLNGGAITYILGADNNGAWSYYSPSQISITPANLSTGGPSWDTSGNLTATRLLAYGKGGNPRNMAIGDLSLNANTSGTNNTAVGYLALYSNTTGNFNLAFGPNTLQTNSTGNNNIGVGQNALTNNTSGSQNLAFGVYSLVNNTTGNNNVGNGQGSLQSNTTGGNNVGIGQAALQNNSTGSYNVGIGANVSSSTTVVSNEVNIYNGAVTARFQGAASSWTFVSDERDKSNIESLEIGLDFISKLQPRKFKWTLRDSDVDQGKEAAGFIAQEVFSVSQEANADYLGLVDTNNPDQFTFAATNLIPVLVNAIKELKAEIELLKQK